MCTNTAAMLIGTGSVNLAHACWGANAQQTGSPHKKEHFTPLFLLTSILPSQIAPALLNCRSAKTAHNKFRSPTMVFLPNSNSYSLLDSTSPIVEFEASQVQSYEQASVSQDHVSNLSSSRSSHSFTMAEAAAGHASTDNGHVHAEPQASHDGSIIRPGTASVLLASKYFWFCVLLLGVVIVLATASIFHKDAKTLFQLLGMLSLVNLAYVGYLGLVTFTYTRRHPDHKGLITSIFYANLCGFAIQVVVTTLFLASWYPNILKNGPVCYSAGAVNVYANLSVRLPMKSLQECGRR